MEKQYFDPKTFQFGAELELGDVDKRTEIPAELGKWEWCEHDIINMLGEYRGVAVDPLGEDCIMGGEINTMPTVGWEDQLKRIIDIIDIFPHPTMSHFQVTHIHMHVPGLCEDPEALKRLTRYSVDEENHQAYLEGCNFKLYDEDFMYDDHDDLDLFNEPTRKMYPPVRYGKTRDYRWYMDYESVTKIPDWFKARIDSVQSLEDLIDIHKMGEARHENGNRKGMPMQRPAVNIYSLKHLKTVEFRAFRGTLDPVEFASILEFCSEYMNAALNTGEPVKSILARHPEWKFPKVKYDHELMVKYRESLDEREARLGKPKDNLAGKNRVLLQPNNV